MEDDRQAVGGRPRGGGVCLIVWQVVQVGFKYLLFAVFLFKLSWAMIIIGFMFSIIDAIITSINSLLAFDGSMEIQDLPGYR